MALEEGKAALDCVPGAWVILLVNPQDQCMKGINEGEQVEFIPGFDVFFDKPNDYVVVDKSSYRMVGDILELVLRIS